MQKSGVGLSFVINKPSLRGCLHAVDEAQPDLQAVTLLYEKGRK